MSFKPSLDQQRSCPTCTDSLLKGDFIITYDVNRESPANVQVGTHQLARQCRLIPHHSEVRADAGRGYSCF